MRPGNVVYDRRGNLFLIVKCPRPTFTGQNAYGLVDLESGTYNDLGITFDSLELWLTKAEFKFHSRNAMCL